MAEPVGEHARTLVVDDDTLVRSVLRTALERIGHTVVEASDRHEAIAAVALSPFDLVILDARMPGPSLPDALQSIVDAREPQPALLIISGAPVDAALLERYSARYLAKPIELRDLMSAARLAVSA